MEIRPENPNEQPLVKQGPTIPELYSRADAADPNSSFDHSQFTPQVLITWSCMQWTPWYWLERREGTSHRLAPSTCGSVSPLVTVQSAPPSHHVHLLLFWEAWHWRLNVTGARALLYRSIPWESAAILAHIELWQVAPCTLVLCSVAGQCDCTVKAHFYQARNGISAEYHRRVLLHCGRYDVMGSSSFPGQPVDPACTLQVVLIEAGGNDFSNGTKPPSNWGAEYKRFLQQVWAHPFCGRYLCILPLACLAVVGGTKVQSDRSPALE